MPSLGFGEIVVILILALLIFGPKRLPEMGRQIGKSMREFRRAASDLRAEIEEDLDDEPPRPSKPRRTASSTRSSASSPKPAPAPDSPDGENPPE